MKPLLEGRVVVVMGAGPGLGHATALAVAQEGAAVVLAARSDRSLLDAQADIEASGGKAFAVRADMTQAADCRKLAETAVKTFGRIDGLVVVAYREPDQRTLAESEDDFSNWRPIVETNIFGALQVIKPVSAMMEKTGGGSIVIINSMTSDLPWPRITPYAASKAALASITRSLALEFGPKKIRINGMHAGGIKNEAAKAYLKFLAAQNGTTPEEEEAKACAENVLGFFPEPADYVGSILYLLSDMSRPVTGQALHVNAGRFMR